MEKIIQIAVCCSQDSDSVYALTDGGKVLVLGNNDRWIPLPKFPPDLSAEATTEEDKPTQP